MRPICIFFRGLLRNLFNERRQEEGVRLAERPNWTGGNYRWRGAHVIGSIEPLSRLRAPDARTEVLARRLSALHALSDEERGLLLRVGAGSTHRHAIRAAMTRPYVANAGRYVLTGWAGRYRHLNDGRRQLLAVALPGDGLNLRPWVNGWSEVVQALTTVQTVEAASIQSLSRTLSGSGLATGMQLADAEEDAFRFDALVRLGRQTAHERLAHLLLELHFRCRSAGLSHDYSYPMPLTQEAVGDLLGLSVVHVNRVMQLMRRDNMIKLKQGQMTLLEPERLTEIAEFCAPHAR